MDILIKTTAFEPQKVREGGSNINMYGIYGNIGLYMIFHVSQQIFTIFEDFTRTLTKFAKIEKERKKVRLPEKESLFPTAHALPVHGRYGRALIKGRAGGDLTGSGCGSRHVVGLWVFVQIEKSPHRRCSVGSLPLRHRHGQVVLPTPSAGPRLDLEVFGREGGAPRGGRRLEEAAVLGVGGDPGPALSLGELGGRLGPPQVQGPRSACP